MSHEKVMTLSKITIAITLLAWFNVGFCLESKNTCNADTSVLYKQFKSYREVVDTDPDVKSLSKYFSYRFNNRALKLIKNANTNWESYVAIDSYFYGLVTGGKISVIYQISSYCLNENSSILHIGSSTYQAKRPILINIEYVLEDNIWKIDQFVFDTRIKTRELIDSSTIYDKFN